jgi:2-keto-4-pentenoate hydratase
MPSENFIDALCANRLRPTPLQPFDGIARPSNLSAAYKAQENLHQKLSAAGLGSRVGFKIGCTTPVMQSFMAIDHPCAGGVMEACVHLGHGKFRFEDFSAPGVECELAVRLGADLLPAQTPFSRASVAPAVAAVMPAIELVDNRYDDFRRFDLETLVADDFFQAACILGPAVAEWQELDLADLAGQMRINGEVTGKGIGADIMGHPLEALAWLANLRAEQGQGLRSGEIVMLGSIVETYWLSPGDHVEIEIEIEGLGSAEASFSALEEDPKWTTTR